MKLRYGKYTLLLFRMILARNAFASKICFWANCYVAAFALLTCPWREVFRERRQSLSVVIYCTILSHETTPLAALHWLYDKRFWGGCVVLLELVSAGGWSTTPVSEMSSLCLWKEYHFFRLRPMPDLFLLEIAPWKTMMNLTFNEINEHDNYLPPIFYTHCNIIIFPSLRDTFGRLISLDGDVESDVSRQWCENFLTTRALDGWHSGRERSQSLAMWIYGDVYHWMGDTLIRGVSPYGEDVRLKMIE